MKASEYQPAPHVLDHLRKVSFVAVVGPTGAGKSTLMKAAMVREPSLHMVLNHTSRQPRPTDRQDGEYHFASRAEMEQRIAAGEFVQIAPVLLGDLYGTAPEDYSSSGVSMLPVLAAAIPAFRKLPFKHFRSVYIVPPSFDEWQSRARRHAFTPEQLARRLLEAESSLVFALEDEQTQLVINESLTAAAEDFATLALGRSLPPRIKADQSRAREIAADMLVRLRQILLNT